MELLILSLLAAWLILALRTCRRKKGTCCGNCSKCRGCK